MSVETVNAHVLIPHRPDWRTRVAWSRKWETKVRETVRGQEERVATRPRGRHRIEFVVNPWDDVENQQMVDRAREVFRTGRAVTPFWGKGLVVTVALTAGSKVFAIEEEPSWEWDNLDWLFVSHPDAATYGTFEAIQLDRFKGDGMIRFQTNLVNSYPAGTRVYPLLFGAGEMGEIELLDDWHGAMAVKVEETAVRDIPEPDTT